MSSHLQDMIDRLDEGLRSHQEMFEAYSKAGSWLRATNDKLMAYNDVQTDKDQLVAKISKLQVIKLLIFLLFG